MVMYYYIHSGCSTTAVKVCLIVRLSVKVSEGCFNSMSVVI